MRRRRIAAGFGVLPFLPARGRDDQNLAFSLSQEIAAGLVRWFDVIALASLVRRPSAHLNEDLLKGKDLDRGSACQRSYADVADDPPEPNAQEAATGGDAG